MDLAEKVLRPGTKIELWPYNQPRPENGTEEPKFYNSQISDFRDDGTVEVYMPTEQGRLLLLSVGSRLSMYCYTVSGIYECSVQVKERYKSNGIYFVLLQPINELRKNQRREYYRYKCTLPMLDRRMEEEERQFMAAHGRLSVSEGLPMDESTIIDISGGGMQFMGHHKYEVNDVVYCKFSFGNSYEVCLKILSSSKIPERAGEYRHRAKFLGMDKKDREAIIRYIFTLERIQKKYSYYDHN